MATKSLIEPVLVALSVALKPLGYAKSGATFSLRNAETIFIISMQSSTSSTSALVNVTVNLGVNIPALQVSQPSAKRPSVWSAQWRQRIGHLLPEKSDAWWSVRTGEEGRSVAAEIVRCVEQFGLPALAQVSTVSELQRLWESGRSPGLTEGQRVRYLQQLAEATAS